jgi:hypothetical protein
MSNTTKNDPEVGLAEERYPNGVKLKMMHVAPGTPQISEQHV